MGRAPRLAGLAIAALLLTSCASAPGGSIGPAAKLLWGLVDGERMMIYGMGFGSVHQLSPTRFEFAMPTARMTYTLSEPTPCHVDTAMEIVGSDGKGQGPAIIHADFSRLTGIEVTEDVSRSGADIGRQVHLNVVWVKFAGEGEMVTPSLPVGYFFTSLNVADFQGAADELKRIC